MIVFCKARTIVQLVVVPVGSCVGSKFSYWLFIGCWQLS